MVLEGPYNYLCSYYWGSWIKGYITSYHSVRMTIQQKSAVVLLANKAWY